MILGYLAYALRRRSAVQAGAAFVALLSVVAFSARPPDDTSRRMTESDVGRALPEVCGAQLAEDRRPFSSDMLRGKVWVLNVWASWCGPCRQEHPVVQSLAKSVPVVGLNYLDQRPDAQQWLLKAGDPFTFTVFDADGTQGARLGVYSVPELYVIDAEGVIRYHQRGPVDAAQVQSTVLPLLKRLKRIS